MIIGLTLSVLIVLTLLSLVLGEVFIGEPFEIGVDGGSTLNDVPSTFTVDLEWIVFEIDPIVGMVVIFIVIIVIAAVLGIQILASGLSPESIRFMMNAILYFGIWAVLSALASPLIFGIEIFGTLIYITLTIGYVIGVLQKQTGGGV